MKPRVVNVHTSNETIFFNEYDHCLLADGDSWFAWSELNPVPSSNILYELQFKRPVVVKSHAYSGDVMRRMAQTASNGAFYVDVKSSMRYDAILLSGGGNDLIDGLYDVDAKQPLVVHPNPAGVAPTDFIDDAKLALLTDYLLANFRQVFNWRKAGTAANAHTPIVLHTYDYPTPRDAPAEVMGQGMVGPWLYRALTLAGVPPQFWNGVADVIFDRVAQALLALHDPADNVHVVDTRNTIARAQPDAEALSGDWINEIHPDAYGYALIAAKINAKLAELGID